MPSNIFATTGTNVSVVFIDKSRTEEQEDVFLVDASSLDQKLRKITEPKRQFYQMTKNNKLSIHL